MDEKRKGEIALLWLKWKMKQEPLHLGKNLRRDLGNRTKDLGIELDEAMEFAEIMVRELVDDTFAQFKKPEEPKSQPNDKTVDWNDMTDDERRKQLRTDEVLEDLHSKFRQPDQK